MSAPEAVKRSKNHLLLMLLLAGLVMLGGPYLLAWQALMPPLRPHAWVVLALAFSGIVIKSLLAMLMGGDFRYDKAGYDMAILSFGGVLTCAALQLVSEEDLYAGLDAISFLKFMSALGVSAKWQHTALLFFLMVVSLAVTLFCALGVADTEKGKPNPLWTAFGMAFGLGLLGAYALAMIAKG
ncbi:hypothetical protein [Amantichitinum ursilacus]|uniref:Uncharacterized protein n=1 Tax=Amantichitinum ursilacus TaxID=857265 RepID=A0A0N1JT65_9NEIS|nr:hypothetical protein [Amantichitinum ursilacus]KPC53735.1 hypothetical protein WG78_07825 [Amantichitinum ursilacus]